MLLYVRTFLAIRRRPTISNQDLLNLTHRYLQKNSDIGSLSNRGIIQLCRCFLGSGRNPGTQYVVLTSSLAHWYQSVIVHSRKTMIYAKYSGVSTLLSVDRHWQQQCTVLFSCVLLFPSSLHGYSHGATLVICRMPLSRLHFRSAISQYFRASFLWLRRDSRTRRKLIKHMLVQTISCGKQGAEARIL
jgi:hypothetical protein